ncbi:MAG TPA: TonB-dependent receptor [Tenuifilaceae bacterium]|mgnify:CR=1 FL=1|nr:TonB-dependent receptor [Tenuifilaceae bacterium]
MITLKKISLTVTTLLLVSVSAFAQYKVIGTITDTETQAPIVGAHISLGKSLTATTDNGTFEIFNVGKGTYPVIVSCVGYTKYQGSVLVDGTNQVVTLSIQLNPERQYIDELVVSATRKENRISEIPGRIELITPEKLAFSAAQTADEYLALLPGVQVSRSFGLFSHKSSVTMRGLSGNEQARTLVLLNGIPVNKADGGSVNWNLISTGEIERIEVVKGPGSALYGGNAMGGVVNIITQEPTKPFQGSVSIDYGTYNTQAYRAKLMGKHSNGFFWAANGLYQKSDGYITQSLADRLANPFIVKSNFDEKAINLKSGFSKSPKFKGEVDFTYYDDVRGTGEKVYQPEGNTTEHDTYQIRATLSGTTQNLTWSSALFLLEEKYKRVSEWYKDDYTWYDVQSVRRDLGLMSSASYTVKAHTLTGGFDIRQGEVDAYDIYYTSTDKVDNKGKIRFYGLYLQDEISLFDKRVTILAGLRYDISQFYDGAFIIHSPSAETSFMDQYQFSGLADETWSALSPRLSAQYKPNDSFRVYAGYSRGFRPSVLDDLCRSGRVRGGFKVANPMLKPEYLNNVELGADFKPTQQIKIAGTTFFSRGNDFLYYVSTGDSIDMGFGNRPIMVRANISDVEIYGLESDISYTPARFITLFANYAYTSAKIKGYKPISTTDTNNLTNKFLSDVPAHSFAAGAFVKSGIVNAGITCKYLGQRYVNDQNAYDDIVLAAQYPSAFTVDVRLSRQFFKHVNASVNIQNIFNELTYDSKGAVSPGRFITAQIQFKID